MKTLGEYVMRVPGGGSRMGGASRSSSGRSALSRSGRGTAGSPWSASDRGGLDGGVAVPADERLIERRAARVVHEHGRSLLAGEVLVAPAHEGDERGRQVDALGREPVLVP